MRAVKEGILKSILGLKKAIDWIGSEIILAKLLKIRRQKLNYWKLYTVIPCDKAMEICVITKGHVTLAELCPYLKSVIKKCLSF